MESRLSETIERLQKEKEALNAKLTELEEEGKKDKSLAAHADSLKDKVTELEGKISTLTISRDECIF